jgi:hypothetical protein
MKLIKAESTGPKIGKPTIGIDRKGIFRFSKTLAIKLELSTDKQVALYYDDDKKSDWYIKMEKGLKVRKASGTSGLLHGE